MAIRNLRAWAPGGRLNMFERPIKRRRTRKGPFAPNLCIECGERWKQVGPYCRRCDPDQRDTRTRDNERHNRQLAKLLQGAILIDPLDLEPRPPLERTYEGIDYEVHWDGA